MAPAWDFLNEEQNQNHTTDKHMSEKESTITQEQLSEDEVQAPNYEEVGKQNVFIRNREKEDVRCKYKTCLRLDWDCVKQYLVCAKRVRGQV